MDEVDDALANLVLDDRVASGWVRFTDSQDPEIELFKLPEAEEHSRCFA